MIRDLLKWVVPGLVTVLGGTTAAVSMATPALVRDLEGAGRATLVQLDASWADLSVSGRDVWISGTTDNQATADLVAARLHAVPGLGELRSTVTVAPMDAPFRLHVSVEDGAISLGGSVPNDELLHELLSLPSIEASNLEIRAGSPDPEVWRTAVDFMLHQAQLMEAGAIELSDLDLSLNGRANSQASFGVLQVALAETPSEVIITDAIIRPILAVPYTWSARFDGDEILVSGHVPNDDLVERYRVASLAGIPIATGLSLASGEPTDFAETSTLLLQQLARLENGEASIVDGVSRLTGTPATLEIAQAVTDALGNSGSIVALQPPLVSDYWVSITRQSGGILVFDGFAPDEATRQRFSEVPDADVNFLKLGGGAPATYATGTALALELLGHLSEGRVTLSGTELSVSGIASSPADLDAVDNLLQNEVPHGLILARSEVAPQRAESYRFAMVRDIDGTVALEGMLPSRDLETQLRGELGAATTGSVTLASGEPTDFAAAVTQAADFLPWLREGRIAFDGTGWTISGTPNSRIDQGAIETEFAVERLAQAGWTLALGSPAAEPAPATPYTWSATKSPRGSVRFVGDVPAPSLKSFLEVRGGEGAEDNTVIRSPAPDGFANDVLRGLEILDVLSVGEVAFDGANWSVTGTAATAQGNAEIASILGEGSAWSVEVADAAAPPVEETSAEAPVEPVAAPDVAVADAPEDLAACSARLAELSAHNAILFQSGAAIIASSATTELDAFASALALCPQTSVYVEGHTDSDGDDQKNLALSVARAEAVVAALIERGVSAGRLYAVGYGESQPIADNVTADGKRQNRRIVVTVRDGDL